jgi:hypothetical protein
VPVAVDNTDNKGLPTRVALLEAKVRVITVALEGMVAAAVMALIAYFFK